MLESRTLGIGSVTCNICSFAALGLGCVLVPYELTAPLEYVES